MKLPAKYIFIFSPYTPRTSFLYTRVSGKFLSYGATDTAGGRYNNKSGVCARVKFVRGGEIIHTRCTYTPRCTGTPSRPRKGRAQTEKRKCAHAHTRRQLFAGFFFFFLFLFVIASYCLFLPSFVLPRPTPLPSTLDRGRGAAPNDNYYETRARAQSLRLAAPVPPPLSTSVLAIPSRSSSFSRVLLLISPSGARSSSNVARAQRGIIIIYCTTPRRWSTPPVTTKITPWWGRERKIYTTGSKLISLADHFENKNKNVPSAYEIITLTASVARYKNNIIAAETHAISLYTKLTF